MVATYRDAIRPKPAPTPPDAVTHEGGEVYAQDKWSRLRRFLILGTDAGTFYVKADEHTKANLAVVKECLDDDPCRVLQQAIDVSTKTLAPKNDPAIAVVALAAAHDYGSIERNKFWKRQAYDAALRVCRTFTHVSHFVQLHGEQISGRGMRRFVERWIANQSARSFALQVVKYPSRDGWSQRDMLILAHPRPAKMTPDHHAIIKYIMTGELPEVAFVDAGRHPSLAPLYGKEFVKNVTKGESVVADAITRYGLPREAVPTEFLNSADVWAALLEDMPYTALIRNLNKMTAVGLFNGGVNNPSIKRAVDQLSLPHMHRVHPITILIALRQYQAGQGDKGHLTWSPRREIVNALDEAFYAAYKGVPSTGKRIRLAIDTSGSMEWGGNAIIGGMTPREVAAAVAMVTLNTEPNAEVIGFTDRIVNLPIKASDRMDRVLDVLRNAHSSATYCNLPIKHALNGRESFDAFVSYTDGETSDATGNFAATLNEYRQKVNRAARSCIVAVTANGLTLNDPADPLGLDIAGFDASVPAVVGEFVAGNI